REFYRGFADRCSNGQFFNLGSVINCSVNTIIHYLTQVDKTSTLFSHYWLKQCAKMKIEKYFEKNFLGQIECPNQQILPAIGHLSEEPDVEIQKSLRLLLMRSVVSSSLWFIYLRGQTAYLLNVFSYCYALDKLYGSCPLVDLWITILVKAGKMDILRNIITVADKRKNGSLLKYIFLNYKCDPSFFFSDNISLTSRTILSREFKANMWKTHLMTNTHCFFYMEVMHFLDDYEHSDAAICRIKELPGWFPRVPKEKIAAMFDRV
ncbi:hypothetical protein ENBRE01_3520, partial [Enteropsectra breve]